MSNPFEAPQSDLRAVGVLSGSRKDLRRIAVYQRTLILCILFQFLLVLGQMAFITLGRMMPIGMLPEFAPLVLSMATMITLLVGAVSVVLLAMKTHGTVFGILLGILAVIPCLGLIVLLIINSKATGILNDNGIKVGFLGADLSQFDAEDVATPRSE